MDKIFDTPITKLLNSIDDSMISELYSKTALHFRYVVDNTMLTLPNPDPATFPKFSEDTLKELLFDECFEFLQKLTNDNRGIEHFPKLQSNLKHRVDLAVTNSIYSEKGTHLGLPFARWVWKDKLVGKISEDVVKFYIIGLMDAKLIEI